MCIELIRQFYDIPRQFRILGDNNKQEFVTYSNQNIKPQYQGQAFGMDLGYRLPVFDLEISSQKANAYTKMSQNELALQFYGLGFFNPQLAEQALMTLDMMDFDNKNMVTNKIQEQATMHSRLIRTQQICLALCQKIDAAEGSNLAEQYAASIMQEAAGEGKVAPVQPREMPKMDSLGSIKEENTIVTNARAKAQAASQPQ